MSAFAEAMAAQKAQRVSTPTEPAVAIKGQARAAASAIRAAVGNAAPGERMEVDGNLKNRRGAQSARVARTHNNNSTPYAKGRPPRNNNRDHAPNPNHNRYGAIELIDKSSDGSRALLSRLNDSSHRDGPSNAGSSRPRATRPAQDGKTTMKNINAEVKTMQRKSVPRYRPDLNTPEMTKWLAGRFSNGVLDMSGLTEDEFLKQQKIIAPGAPDAPPFAGTILWQAVNTIVQREHSTPVSILSLANNGFTSLRQLQRLCWYLRDVRRIDLSGNPVAEVTELKHVNTRLISKKTGASSDRPGPYNDLVELKLAGVPFSERLMAEKGDEGYMNAVLGFFPNLTMLDGVDLTELKAKLAAAKSGDVQSANPAAQTAGVPPPAVPTPIAQVPAADSVPTPLPAADDAVTAQRNEWVAQFSQASGMNTTWSIMCLEKNEWNPEAAWANFNEIRATIPPEAFA